MSEPSISSRYPTAHSHEFVKPGTLPVPGPIGRAFRLILGLGLLWLVMVTIVGGPSELLGPEPPPIDWLIPAAVAVWVVPDVINIGWSRHWGRRPRLVLIALLALGIVLNLAFYSDVWAPAGGWIVIAVFTYIFSHLGVSFLLSVVLGTPGCEMRAIPQLVGRFKGREVVEHSCPGPVDTVDRWERRLLRSQL